MYFSDLFVPFHSTTIVIDIKCDVCFGFRHETHGHIHQTEMFWLLFSYTQTKNQFLCYLFIDISHIRIVCQNLSFMHLTRACAGKNFVIC